jgi:hypothetical protein
LQDRSALGVVHGHRAALHLEGGRSGQQLEVAVLDVLFIGRADLLGSRDRSDGDLVPGGLVVRVVTVAAETPLIVEPRNSAFTPMSTICLLPSASSI